MANRTLSITAPEEDINATIDALCQRGGYKDGDKVAFAQGVLLDWLGRVRAQAACCGIRDKHNKELADAQKAAHDANVAVRAKVEINVK